MVQISVMGTPPCEDTEGQSPSPLPHCRLCVDELDAGICEHETQKDCGRTGAGVMYESCCDVMNTVKFSRAYHWDGERGSLGKNSYAADALPSGFLKTVYLI